VLIHCQAGRNRSVALALAVTMLHEATPLPNLVRRLFQRRPFILTNVSFRQQLAELAEQQQLLISPSPLIDPRQVDGGHRALEGFPCRHCGQPHCVIDEARLDFSLTVDCTALTVGEMVELLEEKLGCEPRIEFEISSAADPHRVAVSCVGYADAAIGRADSLLVPRATPLPVRPFENVALIHLPEPIGNTNGRPSVLTIYNPMRRTMMTLGVYHVPGMKAYQYALCM